MIAGPILPRTPEGLWDVVRSDAERLERGLRIVRRELFLDGELVVDALGADTLGRPVLLFAASADGDAQLVSRITDARDWFERNALMLRSPLEGSAVRVELPPRVIVVGFDFTAQCIERLRRAADPDLEALRIVFCHVDGRRHVGAVPVLGGAQAPAEPPEPLGRIAGLLARLDPELSVVRERYGMSWWIDGALVLRVERGRRGLRAVVPEHEDCALRGEAEVDEVVDAAMRRYLELLTALGEDTAQDETEPHDPRGGPLNGRGLGEGFDGGLEGDFGTISGRAARPGPDELPRRNLGLGVAFGAEITADEYEAFFQDDPQGGGA